MTTVLSTLKILKKIFKKQNLKIVTEMVKRSCNKNKYWGNRDQMASVICLKIFSSLHSRQEKLSKRSYKGGLQSDTGEVRANDEE